LRKKVAGELGELTFLQAFTIDSHEATPIRVDTAHDSRFLAALRRGMARPFRGCPE
jgi:hypothetical protein